MAPIPAPCDKKPPPNAPKKPALFPEEPFAIYSLQNILFRRALPISV